MEDLKGKAAIVTGASRGIGAATVLDLAAKGVSVIALARSKDQLEAVAAQAAQFDGAVFPMACDVSQYSDVEAAIDACNEQFGSVDILVNNAGVIDPIARLGDSDPAEWAKVVDINLKGVYNGIRAALPMMLAKGSGAIVNISSGAATGALEGWSHYCATKAAVLSLTRCVDKEYREHGIRVVGLSPGTVKTDMQVSIKASGINPVSQLDPSVHIPTEWVAKAISWLCTENGDPFAGTDFSLKTSENRALVGLG